MSNKQYYEKKKVQWGYILDALDKKIREDLGAVITLPAVPEVVERINSLADIRELVTSEIGFIDRIMADEEKDEEEG